MTGLNDYPAIEFRQVKDAFLYVKLKLEFKDFKMAGLDLKKTTRDGSRSSGLRGTRGSICAGPL